MDLGNALAVLQILVILGGFTIFIWSMSGRATRLEVSVENMRTDVHRVATHIDKIEQAHKIIEDNQWKEINLLKNEVSHLKVRIERLQNRKQHGDDDT